MLLALLAVVCASFTRQAFFIRTSGKSKTKECKPVANYNTFGLIDTKTKKILLITSSARKCKRAFIKGRRIEVWNGNALVKKIYNKNLADIDEYIRLEKQHIANKQRKAEDRNKKRKNKFAFAQKNTERKAWLNG